MQVNDPMMTSLKGTIEELQFAVALTQVDS